MESPRTIIHVNLVNFYVSVARALEPRLSSYPVVVASAGNSRRVVLDVSQQAFEAGVHRGMTLDVSRRKCPDLVALNPTPGAYGRAHRALIEEAARLSPRVEAAGPGHVFIDLTGTQRLFGRSVDVADRLRKGIRDKYGLPPTVGLAANKLVSKIATRVIKPVGFCTVMHGCEEDFMAPLPVHLMPGIDHTVVRKLVQFNILIIHDLHSILPSELAHALGGVAFDIYRFSHGVDSAPVRRLTAPEPSVEESVVFREQTNDEREIAKELFALAARAAARLRRMGLAARRMVLTLTYADGGRVEKACTLATPVSGDISLFERCESLCRAAYTRRVRLSAMQLCLTKLSYPYGQLDLFLDDANETKLMSALDTVRAKFGTESVWFGRGRGKAVQA